eukprot:TRINITY_DN455_c0_g1_i1.p1 TRINITY_DN455_c0_g1~~TRINITY_DN455_c0_g1_i1.p1  ORF type:complete len:364 (+),score=110.74 TRINITY_DN455_c0_g1_i1:50-1141(+)
MHAGMLRKALVCALLGVAVGADQASKLSLLWLYDEVDSRGPAEWGKLQDVSGQVKYPTCGGVSQSPVNIAAAASNGSLHAMRFNYHAAGGFKISNQGFTVVLTPSNNRGNYFVDPNLGDKNWTLTEIQFHSPSEHSIGGGYYELEMQMVHEAASQQPEGADTTFTHAVVGVMFRVASSPNPHFNFFQHLPGLPSEIATHQYYADKTTEFSPRDVTLADTTFDFGATIPSSKYYTYSGSTTAPPCTESVKWVVMSDVNRISQTQLDNFRSVMGFADRKAVATAQFSYASPRFELYGNFRPTQSLNGRTVSAYTAASIAEVYVRDDDDTAYVLGVIGTVVSSTALGLFAVFVVLSRRTPAAEAAN